MLRKISSWLPWVFAAGAMYAFGEAKAQMLYLNLFIVLMLIMSAVVAFWFWRTGGKDKPKQAGRGGTPDDSHQ